MSLTVLKINPNYKRLRDTTANKISNSEFRGKNFPSFRARNISGGPRTTNVYIREIIGFINNSLAKIDAPLHKDSVKIDLFTTLQLYYASLLKPKEGRMVPPKIFSLLESFNLKQQIAKTKNISDEEFKRILAKHKSTAENLNKTILPRITKKNNLKAYYALHPEAILKDLQKKFWPN